jgi:hypothetical protein
MVKKSDPNIGLAGFLATNGVGVERVKSETPDVCLAGF